MQLHDLPLDDLSPTQLWKALDEANRRDAAEAMYDDRETRLEADTAIAAAIHFRDASVRKLPVAQRVGYLLRASDTVQKLRRNQASFAAAGDWDGLKELTGGLKGGRRA